MRYKTPQSQVLSGPFGSISLFLPGISLSVRHTKQVHNEVADRLLQLRHLVHQRDGHASGYRVTAKKITISP